MQMSPKMALRVHLSRLQAPDQLLGPTFRPSRSICLFCSVTRSLDSSHRSRQPSVRARRFQSTTTPTTTTPDEARLDPRTRLENALLDLQKHAANYVNLSRLQLALQGIKQQPGSESIRIAVLAQNDGRDSSRTAKELVRLLLADPLKPEASWEAKLREHDLARPLIVRVETEAEREVQKPQIAVARASLIPELVVQSPALERSGIELLLMETNLAADARQEGVAAAIEDAVLVPTVDIPTSGSGRYTPITNPVHRAIVVGEGLMGAASALVLAGAVEKTMILSAVQLNGEVTGDDAPLPFVKLDIHTAEKGLDLLRQDVTNAIDYETFWFDGNIPAVSAWLKEGSVTDPQGRTKQAVRDLIISLLYKTSAAIDAAASTQMGSVLATRTSPSAAMQLRKSLALWAEKSHNELQTQLDLAFSDRRWRKLAWWKLIWRADDVSLLSSELLNQRFLSDAERGTIYLAGRINETGLANEDALTPTYAAPLVTALTEGATTQSEDVEPSPELEGKWPTYIAYTRRYLLEQTVPALQALAQRLVVQTASTSALASAFAALGYVSSFGIYESGSLAALGLVWSLGRLQRKWETAREYWEGEVREEGRKAIRATEASFADLLDGTRRGGDSVSNEAKEMGRARNLVKRAEEALKAMR
jgi:hypothetical protein